VIRWSVRCGDGLAAGHSYPKLRELARVREAIVDYLLGTNEFGSSDALWQSYFDHFNYAARVNRTR